MLIRKGTYQPTGPTYAQKRAIVDKLMARRGRNDTPYRVRCFRIASRYFHYVATTTEARADDPCTARKGRCSPRAGSSPAVAA